MRLFTFTLTDGQNGLVSDTIFSGGFARAIVFMVYSDAVSKTFERPTNSVFSPFVLFV